MTETELIARQAKQIEELKDSQADLRERMRQIHLIIYCIGGPLNDNKLKYTNSQLVTFAQIAHQVEE